MRRLRCNKCGKDVSTPVPDDTIVRAWIECPECIEKSGAPSGDYGILRWALKQIIQDLPTNRDWLDPNVERVARGILAETEPKPERNDDAQVDFDSGVGNDPSN